MTSSICKCLSVDIFLGKLFQFLSIKKSIIHFGEMSSLSAVTKDQGELIVTATAGLRELPSGDQDKYLTDFLRCRLKKYSLTSLVQNTEGGGLPLATQSNLAMPLRPTLAAEGRTMNTGSAENKNIFITK